MLSLQNILDTKGQEFIDNLFNKEVIVNEKLNAATLCFRKKASSEMDLNRRLTFYKGSGINKKEITVADKVMTTFYSAGMTYLSNMSGLIIDRIPANWTFVCRYFPNNKPSFIHYSVLPKNNLVLSCIITNGGTKIEDSEDLRSWAEMFGIAYQEPVFRGYLSEYQKERLNDYIKDGSSNRESFARFVITMLNPSLTHSLYQEDGFEAPIDGFIFKFISDDGVTKPVSAKLIDPYMSGLISKSKSKKGFEDNKDVLLSDFTIFMMGQDLDSIILTGETDEDRYLELFYRLFNRYIKYKKAQLEDFDIDTNDVVKEGIDIDFTVDLDRISNETTKKLLKENPEYKGIFKTLLGSFRTKKPEDYKSLVMAPNVVRMFNGIVDKISEKSKVGHKSRNMSFSEYISTIKGDKDINDLNVDNAPEEVKAELGIKTEPAVQREPLSFSDFKKKEEKESDEKKEKKELKDIEDMIKQLKDSVKDLSDDMKKSKEEEEKQTEKIEDLEKKEEKEGKDKKDDRKEDSGDKKESGGRNESGDKNGEEKKKEEEKPEEDGTKEEEEKTEEEGKSGDEGKSEDDGGDEKEEKPEPEKKEKPEPKKESGDTGGFAGL